LNNLLRRRWLIPLLFSDPRIFYGSLVKDAELLVDRVRSHPGTYEALDWPVALDQITRWRHQAASVMQEPRLEETEREVLATLEQVRAASPWKAGYNSDLRLARALYLVCRLLRPATVVETGVAYGLSSAYILTALDVNQQGHLHSVDLPPLGGDATRLQGALIPKRLRTRWTLHSGTSRRILPGLLAGKRVDVFVHDSLHTYRTMRWEFQTTWPQIPPGGALIADDIEGNRAFDEVLARGPAFSCVVRQADKPSALFGVAIK
jgi:hypothetical protein